MNGVLTGMAWKRHKSLIDETANVFDIGVGPDAAAQTGYTTTQIGHAISRFHEEIFKHGAMLLMIDGVRIYLLRRDRCIDVGTRKDFEVLEWEDLCDLLDAAFGG